MPMLPAIYTMRQLIMYNLAISSLDSAIFASESEGPTGQMPQSCIFTLEAMPDEACSTLAHTYLHDSRKRFHSLLRHHCAEALSRAGQYD